jgi:putative ABC transport system permease protein
MDDVLDVAAARPRFTASLLAALSGTALFLAIVGLYGVVTYSVAQRTGELGVRLALGAQRSDILRLVLRQGAGLALGGVLAGLAISALAMRLLVSQLYRVSPTDPATFAGSAVLFIAVAALASYLPARRAMRVDPLLSLRGE